MKLLDARSKVGYDTEDFEAKAAEAIMGLRDERIVKPRQFKISETDPRGIMNGISVYSDEEMDRVEACNARILWGTPKYTEGEKAGYDAVFKCVVPSQLELAHQSKVFGLRGINFLEEFIQNKVVGDPNFEIHGRLRRVRGIPTYLKEENADARNYLGGANEVILDNGGTGIAYWQFDISVPELLKTRTVFFDPEGTCIEREYKKTYVVFGGIPFQAITKAKIKVEPCSG